MPPLHSKPWSTETSNDSNTTESENRQTLSIDLSEINNLVTNFKTSSLKNNKQNRKFKFTCNICEKSVSTNQK